MGGLMLAFLLLSWKSPPPFTDPVALVDMESLRSFPANWKVLITRIKTQWPFWLATYYTVGTAEVDGNTKEILEHGMWEPTITQAFANLLADACQRRPGTVVVDVGANIGYFSFLSASMGCYVHAFEPVPENLKLLAMGLIMNPELNKQISLHPNICTDQPGPLEISGTNVDGHVKGSYENDGIHQARKQELGGFKDSVGIPVQTLSIDEAVRKTHGSDATVELLKVDVEGYEPHVMRSARSLFNARKVKTILFEYNMWRGMSAKQGVDMLKELKGFGFYLFVALSTTCEPHEIATETDFEELSKTLMNHTNKCYKFAAMVVGTLDRRDIDWYKELR